MASKALHRELKRSEDFLERTNRAARVGGWEMDLVTNEVRWTRETKQLHGVRSNFEPTLDTALSFYREDSRNIIRAAVQRCIDEGTSWEVQLPMTTADGRAIWTRVVGGRHRSTAIRAWSGRSRTSRTSEPRSTRWKRARPATGGCSTTAWA